MIYVYIKYIYHTYLHEYMIRLWILYQQHLVTTFAKITMISVVVGDSPWTIRTFGPGPVLNLRDHRVDGCRMRWSQIQKWFPNRVQQFFSRYVMFLPMICQGLFFGEDQNKLIYRLLMPPWKVRFAKKHGGLALCYKFVVWKPLEKLQTRGLNHPYKRCIILGPFLVGLLHATLIAASFQA